LSPTIFCNASWPIIDKIAPKKRYGIIAQLRNKSKETKIKLGFKFIELDKNSDISKVNYKNDKDTLWSEEKNIE
jgi:hypothetical protein